MRTFYEFIFWLVACFAAAGFMWWFAMVAVDDHNKEALDNCAKLNNVYQCEMLAVPKSGEK